MLSRNLNALAGLLFGLIASGQTLAAFEAQQPAGRIQPETGASASQQGQPYPSTRGYGRQPQPVQQPTAAMQPGLTNADRALIRSLGSQQYNDYLTDQLGNGLTPERLELLKQSLLQYEGVRNNPVPPKTKSSLKVIKPGDVVQLSVMQHFPVTLMLADQYGEPLEITHYPSGNEQALTIEPMTVEVNGKEITDSLYLVAQAPMRSTVLTLRVKEHRLPVQITVKTLPAGEGQVTIQQELRLSWVNRLNAVKVVAGKHLVPDISQRADRLLMDTAAGLPPGDGESGIHEISLSGRIDAALYVDEKDRYWYLRLPYAANLLNVAIDKQVQSQMSGYRAYRLNGMPPQVITVSLHGDQVDAVINMPQALLYGE